MKQIHMALLAATVIAPSAVAEGKDSQPTPFSIVVSSPVAPESHPDYRYPYLAGRKGIDGACEVSFSITPSGQAQGVRVVSCSSEIFANAAESVVKTMAFERGAQPRTAVVAKIRWDINPVTLLASAD